METKEVTISVPEGFEIDKENSTFEKIVFKKKKEIKSWKDDKEATVKGYVIDTDSKITSFVGYNVKVNYNLFATEKLAKAALAAARISQIIANDSRFGGVITDKEWKDDELIKYVILRDNYLSTVIIKGSATVYNFLSFHTMKQAELFISENTDLINDYLMM